MRMRSGVEVGSGKADGLSQGVEGGGFVEEFDAEFGDDDGADGLEGLEGSGGEFNGVFGGGEEAVGGEVLGGLEEAVDVFWGVGVVVGEAVGAGGLAAGVCEHGEEVFRAGESAEGDGALREGGGEFEGAADGEGGGCGVLRDDSGEGGGFVFADEEDVGAAERGEGFAQIAGGEELIGDVLPGEEDEVERAGELAVLEAVVEEVCLRGQGGFGELAGLVAECADEDLQAFAGHFEGFVAEALRGAVGVDFFDGAGAPAVAAGEDVEGDSFAFEESGEHEDHGSLAGTAGGEAADADDGALQASGAKGSAIVEGVFDGNARAVEGNERQQRGPARSHGTRTFAGRRSRSVVTVRSVAPVWASK